MQLAALASTAAIPFTAPVEEMLQGAHDTAEDTRYSAAFFIGGFAPFTPVASYFEG